MTSWITNATAGLLVVPLRNTGEAIHLAPGERSRPLEDHELQGDELIPRLVDQGLVDLEQEPAEPPPTRTRRAARKGSPGQ